MVIPDVVRLAVRPALTLEARTYDRGEDWAVIAPPHPLYGGSIDNPVVRALEGAFAKVGISTLTFNYRGIGESTGEPSGEPADAFEDYLAATKHWPGRTLICVSGYSFGAMTALRVAGANAVPCALLVSPPVDMLEPGDVANYKGKLTVICGSEDEYSSAAALAEVFQGKQVHGLQILPDVDHFYLGSGSVRLAHALATLVPALLQ